MIQLPLYLIYLPNKDPLLEQLNLYITCERVMSQDKLFQTSTFQFYFFYVINCFTSKSHLFLEYQVVCVLISNMFLFSPGEAKNLPGRNNGAACTRDIYCVLSLDQEEIFRTSTIERTLKYVPFLIYFRSFI